MSNLFPCFPSSLWWSLVRFLYLWVCFCFAYIFICIFVFLVAVVVVQSLSRVQLFETPRTAACQAPLSFTNSWSLLRFMSIESMMPSNYPILCCPLFLFPSLLPSLGSFQITRLFASGDQSIEASASASASVLPVNIQDWFPLGWTSWISLQSKGLSRVFSNTTVQKHLFFGAQLSLWSNSHIDTWLLEKP